MSKPNSCKYCAHRVECDKSYRRYVHEGTEHKCFYELKKRQGDTGKELK